MATQKKVLIIGGGVIGFSCAFELLKAGHEVVLLEKNERGADSCSTGNAGMIVPSHFIPLAAPGMILQGLKWMFDPESPFTVKPRVSLDLLMWGARFYRASRKERVEPAVKLLHALSVASRERFVELADKEGLTFGLKKHGLLMLCKTQHVLEEEALMAKQANDLQMPAEVMTQAEAQALDPSMTLSAAGAVYFPQDCHLVPDQYLKALIERVEAMGADVHFSSEAQRIERKGDQVVCVKTKGNSFVADEILLAGGAWTPALAQSLGVHLPMQSGKGYSMTLAEPRQLPEICSILCEARVAVTPMGGELRVGGTMEITGMDHSVNRRRVRGIIRSVPDYFPAFQESDFEGEAVWSGLRPCTPDGLPYLGRIGGLKNLSVAAGHAMLGVSLSPITAQLMARIISDEDPGMDLSLVSPDRFRASVR